MSCIDVCIKMMLVNIKIYVIHPYTSHVYHVCLIIQIRRISTSFCINSYSHIKWYKYISYVTWSQHTLSFFLFVLQYRCRSIRGWNFNKENWSTQILNIISIINLFITMHNSLKCIYSSFKYFLSLSDTTKLSRKLKKLIHVETNHIMD